MNTDELEARALWVRLRKPAMPERYDPYFDPNYRWQEKSRVAR